MTTLADACVEAVKRDGPMRTDELSKYLLDEGIAFKQMVDVKVSFNKVEVRVACVEDDRLTIQDPNVWVLTDKVE